MACAIAGDAAMQTMSPTTHVRIVRSRSRPYTDAIGARAGSEALSRRPLGSRLCAFFRDARAAQDVGQRIVALVAAPLVHAIPAALQRQLRRPRAGVDRRVLHGEGVVDLVRPRIRETLDDPRAGRYAEGGHG